MAPLMTPCDADETPRTSCEITPTYSVYTARNPPCSPNSSSASSKPVSEKNIKSTAPSIIEISQSPTLVDISDRAPDGGLRAWLVVLGSFLIHCFCFAPTEYIFGIFEQHYLELYPSSSHGSIAFIGTLGSSVTYFAGFVSGVCADKFGYRITALLGTSVMALALILASFANQVWQLYLSQGVLLGIGASLVYYPAIGAPSHWFDAKRGLALGLAVSGTGLGGLGLAPATQAMMDAIGVNWSLRVLALVCLVVCLFIGLTAQDGALIAGLSSGASCLGRIILGFAADRLPKTIVVSCCAWITAGSILIIWTLSKSFGIYLFFALVYGFFAGGYVSLVPLVVSETFGAHQLSTVIGFMYAASGVGMLAGAPVAGMILDATKPNITYLPVIMTAGGTLLLGAICVSLWVFFRRQAKKAKRDGVASSTVSAIADL
ncbi:hypothetical protein BGX21_004225 [Mortierella sp. AD011]|nr:hypothetical protein BGX21_004225 [Mortierella sp. AD011]